VVGPYGTADADDGRAEDSRNIQTSNPALRPSSAVQVMLSLQLTEFGVLLAIGSRHTIPALDKFVIYSHVGFANYLRAEMNILASTLLGVSR